MFTIDSSLVLSLAMAVAAGLVGCFAVMRRMTLAADAFSHVALPGIGLALLFHQPPLAGAVAALLAGGLVIWALERRAALATETIVGVVFTTALAVGVLLSSGEELIDTLFGRRGALGLGETVFGLAVAALVITFILKFRNGLVLALVSGDIAHAAGVPVARLNLAFFEIFALTVALGLRFLGVLLMGSLIILPAAAAKQLAGSLRGMMIWSCAIATGATLAGTLIARVADRSPGPVIVCVAALCFGVSLVRRTAFTRA